MIGPQARSCEVLQSPAIKPTPTSNFQPLGYFEIIAESKDFTLILATAISHITHLEI